MTTESFQETLFEDPIGLRFRHAREKRGIEIEKAAHEMKLPVAVLEAIEREDWARLGAPIFIRSYVGSYARLLGLPATLADEVVRGKPAPQLGIAGSTPPVRGVFDRSVMNLAYLAMTVVIVGSVVMLALYFQGPRRSAEVLPLAPPGGYAAEDTSFNSPTPATPTSGPGDETSRGSQGPVMASLAPSLANLSSLESSVVLQFTGDSWVDLTDRNGKSIERGLIAAGSERSYKPAELGRVMLGDASAVRVSLAGKTVDLTPYREARVARFTVSSDGSLQPVASQ